MADFKLSIDHTLNLEGGVSDHVSDRGGLTKYGISSRSYPELDIKNLTIEKAKEIYKRDFWDKLSLDKVTSQDVAGKLFDIAVNAGWPRAGRMLQEALNKLLNDKKYLMIDALVGAKTILAVNHYKYPGEILTTLRGLQFMHYWQIIARDPGQGVFFRGWLKRVKF